MCSSCKYRRSGNFHVRNVRGFNFRHVVKWRKSNARVRNFHEFNFRSLASGEKFLTAKIS